MRVIRSLMERWNGVVKVPSANAIFFTGDRVQGTGNPVIERLSDTENIAQVLVSKFSKLGVLVNAWVVEASCFNGPFAVYKEFIPCVNSRGEPQFYNADGFPASTSTVLLLSKALQEVRAVINRTQEAPQVRASTSNFLLPKTIVFGFSKGGTVVNQLVTELAHVQQKPLLSSSDVTKDADAIGRSFKEEIELMPNSKECLLNSISEIHYVDVGLNSTGAYLTDESVIGIIAERIAHGASGIRFALHGTPRQWCDSRRPWIANEKNGLCRLLENAAQRTAGRVEVWEKLYFANMAPNMQMHFEIIEVLDLR